MAKTFNAKLTDNTDKEDVSKGREAFVMKLRLSETRLIQIIRSIEFGEIEGLKIENGQPSYYRSARKTCKLL